jgi:hypothetical protein
LEVAEALWACLHGVVLLLLNQPCHVKAGPRRLPDVEVGSAIRGFLHQPG